jgi:hypothetical protein
MISTILAVLVCLSGKPVTRPKSSALLTPSRSLSVQLASHCSTQIMWQFTRATLLPAGPHAKHCDQSERDHKPNPCNTLKTRAISI